MTARERLARLVCPSAFASWDRSVAYTLRNGGTQEEADDFARWCDDGAHPFNRISYAYERADAILAAGFVDGVQE